MKALRARGRWSVAGTLVLALVLLLLLVTALLFAGCVWRPESSTGSIVLRFTLDEAAEVEAQSSGGAVRVFLVAGVGSNRRLYPLAPRSGVPYMQTALSRPPRQRAQVVIDGIPEGEVYQLHVAVGSSREGALWVGRYGQSSLFKIAAGSEVSVTIDLQETTFDQVTLGLPGTAIAGMALVGESLYAAYAGAQVSELDWLDDELALEVTDDWTVGKVQIAAVSPGVTQDLLLATSGGIYAGPQEGAFSRLSHSLGRGPLEWPPAATGVTVAAPNEGSAQLMYHLPGGIGGWRDVPDGQGSFIRRWFFIDTRGELDGDPVLALTTNGLEYLFLSTRVGGALRLAGDSIDPAPAQQNSWTTIKQLASAGTRFDNAVPRTITALALADSGNSITLLAGTPDGIWSMPGDAVDEDWSPPRASATRLPGTAGRHVTRIAVHGVGANLQLAALTPFELLLVLPGGRGLETHAVPFVAAYPGLPTDLVWLDSQHLAVSGSEGIVVLNVAP